MNARKAVVVSAVAATTTLALSSCSTQSTGNPQPNSSNSDNGKSSLSTQTHTSTRSSKSNTLANTDPCKILSTSALENLKISVNGRNEKVASARTCKYQYDEYLLSISIRVNGGIDALNDNHGPLTNTSVGDHDAVKQVTQGTCFYFIGVTKSSRVGVGATKGIDPDCATAKKAAELVEPNLPKS